MKEYVLWVATPDKEFNITFIRDKKYDNGRNVYED